MGYKLQVGDRLYMYGRTQIANVFTIDRITATQAISGKTKFKIEIYDNGIASVIGDSNYYVYIYQLENDVLKAKYRHQLLVGKFTNIDPWKLTEDQLHAILAITNQ